MSRLSVDLGDLESPDVLDLLPLLFFSRDDLENTLSNSNLPFNTLHILNSRLSFLEELQLLDIPHLWSVTKPDGLRCKDALAVDFENHATDGKLKLLISILLHLNEKPSTSLCSTRSCCSLFDIEAYEFELVALLSGLVYGVPEVNFLCDFVCGYLIHTRSVNCRFLCLVFRNFPSEWMTIWNCMMNITEHVSLNYLEFPKNASGRPTLNPEESTFRTTKPNEVVATAGVKSVEIRPELMLHRIENVLRWLLIANSTYVGMGVEFCITTQTFPALLMDGIFLLDRKQKGYLLVLLKRLLLDDGAEVRGWISAYLKRQSGCDSHVGKLNEYFIKYSAELIPMDRDEPLTDEAMLSALALLRVIAALRGFANYTFPPVLSSQLLDLLTHKTVQTERGSHYTIYALAFLIGLRTSLSLPSDPNNRNHSSDTEDRIVIWLQGLIEHQDAFEPNNRLVKSSVPLSSNKLYFEPLLLLAILFHTNQPGPITDLISNLLGLRIPSLGRTVNSWRKILLQSVFTENMIATHAARVPITRSLSRRLSTHLPIQCILQLLQSHAFAKNKLEIKASVFLQCVMESNGYCTVTEPVELVEWIIGQIYESVCPMHPLLPDLVEAHIMHSFGTTSVCGESTALISECELLSVFSPTGKFAIAQLCTPAADVDQDCTVNWDSPTGQWCSGSTIQPDLTPALLFLYYALFVYDYQLTTRLASSRHCAPGEQPCVYSDQLWERIPITYLLQHARSRPTDFGPLYPRLLHLTTNHFPHLTVGELMIQDELLLDPFWSPEHFDSHRPDSVPRCDLSINDSPETECRSSTDLPMCCTPAQLNEGMFELTLCDRHD
ncbi:hypothetical protein P879_04352 [Paragonimus westermani]|uniref:Uncharacterized protein n=1 Tax=Paragonimus westermani TaxID=34504 RepID=A0A8T0DFH3_9TREM|nr:hypothetical protein P879_04352 [Paragonimus westermani]